MKPAMSIHPPPREHKQFLMFANLPGHHLTEPKDSTTFDDVQV